MTYSSQLRSWVCYFLASWLVNDETWMVHSASKFWLMSHLSLHSCILVHKLRNRNIPRECSRTNTGQDCCASFEHTSRNNSFFLHKMKKCQHLKAKNECHTARKIPSINFANQHPILSNHKTTSVLGEKISRKKSNDEKTSCSEHPWPAIQGRSNKERKRLVDTWTWGSERGSPASSWSNWGWSARFYPNSIRRGS